MARVRRLVIVSNRLPVTRAGTGAASRWSTSTGGLVTALVPILQQSGGQWVGWTGEAGRGTRPFEHDAMQLRPVTLTPAEVESYYHGYCNRTLWPLFHDAIRTPEFEQSWWKPYVEVNRRFARATAAVAARREAVWIHDYHLMLAPALIRELRPDLKIGFFLHIPFPPEELFSWLPRRKELLEGLLGADVVGFQTHGSVRNFSRLARQFTESHGTDTSLQHAGRSVRIQAFPISIDFDWFHERAQAPDTVKRAAEIRKRIGAGRKIMLAVDRLDYTKGIDTRLRAYESLLTRGAVSVDDCVLIQIASPSREQVREYEEMRTMTDRMVGSINGEFSEPGRVAVHYFRRTLTREELVPYYAAADVMLVTPLRDGMNLVCKEYVASRSDATGVLVLSEFAGAAEQMRMAVRVNPRDIEGTADAMRGALRMSRSDQRFRMGVLRSTVRRHDVHDWAKEFLEALWE